MKITSNIWPVLAIVAGGLLLKKQKQTSGVGYVDLKSYEDSVTRCEERFTQKYGRNWTYDTLEVYEKKLYEALLGAWKDATDANMREGLAKGDIVETRRDLEVYTLESWSRDKTLNPQIGQRVSQEVIDELAGSMWPTTYTKSHFQPGEAETSRNGVKLYDSFGKGLFSNDWVYMGLKPAYKGA